MKKTFTKMLIGGFMLSLLTLAPTASGAGVTYFSDMEPYMDTYQAVDYLLDNAIVKGYDDGTYKEDQNINRAEFVKIVMGVSDVESSGGDCFDDVTDQWFAPYVCTAADLGIVSGYPDGSFKPAQEINFAEASKIIANVFELELPVTEEKEWFDNYVLALEENAVIPYNIDNFGHTLTRGEMAELVWRLDNNVTYKVSNTYKNISTGATVPEKGADMMTFDSCTELYSYIDNNETNYFAEGGGMMGVDDFAFAEESSPAVAKSVDVEASDAAPEVDGGSEDYSSTNVQVAGVDEADIVKNDGKYVYYLKNQIVKIAEAYPAGGMEVLSEIDLTDDEFYPGAMYLDGDKLVMLGNTYDYLFEDYGYYGGESRVMIYDISDKENPEVFRKVDFDGLYSTSRKVGDTVYIVMDQYNYYWDDDLATSEDNVLPMYKDDSDNGAKDLVSCGDVKYIPGVTGTTDYMIVAAIDISEDDSKIESEVIMGATGDVYASKDNLYIAEQKYGYWYWYDESGQDEETYVYRFSLDGTDIEYSGVGHVPGTILNQFSMDEDGDYFRMATTTGGWWSDQGVANNVYVLDADLDVIGAVEGLAPGEEIYSTRFIGDRLYMVTFEQIDPLFVIDLANPKAPKVLGELKIPGVSQYLHPLDEDHIIGFGQDATDAGDWSWFQGVKLSLFDVSDVNAPREVDHVVIGDRGTYSELLYNHKALLFDANKGIMAFPVTVAEIPQGVKDDLDLDSWVYGENVFQGAYVYDVDTSGFSLRGTISHYEEDQLGNDFDYYWSYGDESIIERILYIGDNFYTVSEDELKASEMDSLDETASLKW